MSIVIKKLIIDPVFDFVGINPVIEAWKGRKYEGAFSKWAQRISRVCLILLGFANFFDTILDLVISMMGILSKDECNNLSTKAIILFTMTICAGYARTIGGKIQISGSAHGELCDKLYYYVALESIIFAWEDGASMFFLASRPCDLNPVEYISLALTVGSFIPLVLVMIICVVLVLEQTILRDRGTFKDLLPFLLYGLAFLALFGFQMFIALTQIFNRRDIEKFWYTDTLFVCGCGVVLIPPAVVAVGIITFGGLEKKPT